MLPPLTDFAGLYDHAGGATIELVAGDELFAVLDEAKYPLRRAGADVFVNATGDSIPFRRDASGTVTGFVERGTLRRRRSVSVSAEAAALADPRAAGAEPYRYHPPAGRGDGIAVGDIARTPLGVETAERVVGGVLDGTWPDVHAVLLYQRGRLVLEEYFHGYDAERPHPLRSASKSVVSALAGAAIDRGAPSCVDEPVLAKLGYGGLSAYAHPDPRKARITLVDLLTMRPGLACDDHDGRSPGRETLIYERPDWVKAVLDLPMESEPGTAAHYCSGAVMLAGRMHARARDPLRGRRALAGTAGDLRELGGRLARCRDASSRRTACVEPSRPSGSSSSAARGPGRQRPASAVHAPSFE